MQVWRAQQAYRVRTCLGALIMIPLGLLPLSHLLQGHWGSALGIVVVEVGTLWGLRWLGRRVRGWWQGLAVLVVLSVSLSGCQDVVRAVANLHGYQGDVYASPCAPESLQAGRCVTKEGEKR
jgi:hypothetical protein